MTHASARRWKRVLRRLLPSAAGRHSASGALPGGHRPAPSAPVPALCGEALGLVRPYLVAHERRLQAQRLVRRRTLRVAPRGLWIEGRR
ncbi:hypothetical protein [Streptomyces sp. NPDC046821]|uniref:hypothetical protein n=1 Tax=Streptomyces sp. NPDC046821 TaxID=3154702 RepID=UPI0033CF2A8E